jgi:chaperone required for assembly of F1-ATPase
MKKFYSQASAGPTDDGFGLFLDGKRMQTPAKQPLSLPNQALASAIAKEWAAQDETIEPKTMPLTQLAATAQDRMSQRQVPVGQESERDKTLRILAEYAATDLLCYRSTHPQLAERQAAAWQPWLDWAAGAHGIVLHHTQSLMPVEQPEATMLQVAKRLADMDAWELTAFMVLCPGLGSFVLALAVRDHNLSAEQAVKLASLDEAFQEETWGKDDEARQALAAKQADMEAAERFLQLI